MEVYVRGVRTKIITFLKNEAGITALEYGIMASILSVVLVGIFSNFGSTLTTLFGSIATSV
jgi:pilus assembly protein Flp/PilA